MKSLSSLLSKKLRLRAAREELLCVYIPFSGSYLPVNYLYDIKLNRGDLSNIFSPHTLSALPFIVDDLHIERYWGANVGVGRWHI
jgi:hypothetical protein